VSSPCFCWQPRTSLTRQPNPFTGQSLSESAHQARNRRAASLEGRKEGISGAVPLRNSRGPYYATMPKWSGFAQLIWISRFSPPIFRLSPRSFFAVHACTSRIRLYKRSKGYGERKLWRMSSRTIEVYDVLKDDHILAPKRA
jgi:hypothetical protein